MGIRWSLLKRYAILGFYLRESRYIYDHINIDSFWSNNYRISSGKWIIDQSCAITDSFSALAESGLKQLVYAIWQAGPMGCDGVSHAQSNLWWPQWNLSDACRPKAWHKDTKPWSYLQQNHIAQQNFYTLIRPQGWLMEIRSSANRSYDWSIIDVILILKQDLELVIMHTMNGCLSFDPIRTFLLILKCDNKDQSRTW